MSQLRMYRLMNLGNGEANQGKYGVLGSPFPICADCLQYYDPAVTNNIDSRLVEDLQEPLPAGAECSYYKHAKGTLSD